MILIVAGDEEFNVPRITKKLDERGAEYLRFNPRSFPREASLSVSCDRAGTMRRVLRCGQRETDLARVTSAWNLTRARPVPDSAVAEEQQWWVAAGCERWLAELWECLDCFWAPTRPIADRDPYRAYNPPAPGTPPLERPLVLRAPSGHNKLHQLATARRLGLAIPRTLFTNNPDDFLDFHQACEGLMISKSAFKVRATRNQELAVQWTSRLDRRAAARYQSIRHAPVLFQEQVPKRLELRVTVVGRKVFAAAIESQENVRISGDWRHYPELDAARHYSAWTLPAGVEKLCVELTAALGLSLGAIDLILTPSGEYVFLEINPNGQWIFIEEYTGLPIGDAIAEMLIRGAA